MNKTVEKVYLKNGVFDIEIVSGYASQGPLDIKIVDIRNNSLTNVYAGPIVEFKKQTISVPDLENHALALNSKIYPLAGKQDINFRFRLVQNKKIIKEVSVETTGSELEQIMIILQLLKEKENEKAP